MKKNLLMLAIAIFSSLLMMAQTVSKFVGVYNPLNGSYTSSSVSFPNANFYGPCKIFFDNGGRGWIVEGNANRIRMIDALQTTVYLRAGSASGVSGSANNIAGSMATFTNPTDMVMDTLGNMYVSDAGNNLIRKIAPYVSLAPQAVTTYAGVVYSGSSTLTYVDGAVASARFNYPSALAIDNFGNIYVSDTKNNCIRKINVSSGTVSLLAGSSTQLSGNIDSVGQYASFSYPSGLCWYSSTELLVADLGNSKIRKVNILTQRVTTFAGTGTAGNNDGDALTQATFTNPQAIAMDTSLNIYVTDAYSNMIRKITGSCVTTYAGNSINAGNAPSTDTANGVGSNARFNMPFGISFFNGALYVADNGNNSIRKVTVPNTPRDYIPVAKFSIASTGNTHATYNLIDSTAGNYFTGNQRWKITPGSYSYVGGTDSTSANAQIKFNSKTLYTITLTDANCWGKNSLTSTIDITNAGINEVNADKYIAVYPNPTNGIFEISINTIEANSIRVMDINGKTILERKILLSKENIDMTGFSRGVYILNISGKEFSLNKKLILE